MYTFNFYISDKKKPTAVCENGVSMNLANTNPPAITAWVTDVLQYVSDNTSPNIQTVGICFDGPNADAADVCTGQLPVFANGIIDTTVVFGCSHLGLNTVQVWAEDAYGNQDYCETIIDVQDIMGTCGGGNTTMHRICAKSIDACRDISGNVQLVDGVTYEIVDANPFSINPFFTDTCSQPFIFPISGASYEIEPSKDIHYLENVNTFDLLTIQKHLLGNSDLASPYLLIAADVNASGSITPSDIVELRKLILGIYPNGLPNNTSWRFIDASYIFPNPAHPFSEDWPSIISLSSASDTLEFIGIKIGHVDCTPLRLGHPIALFAQDQKMRAGEEYSIRLTPAEAVQALQGTLEFDGLELLSVVPIAHCNLEDFALHTKENALTFAWIGDKTPVFEVKVRALEKGLLSEKMRLTENITALMAGSLQSGQHGLVLDFSIPTPTTWSNGQTNFRVGTMADLALGLEVSPTVFSDAVTVQVSSPNSATLQVVNQLGQPVFEKSALQGQIALELSGADISQSGLYFCILQSDKGRLVKRIVRQ